MPDPVTRYFDNAGRRFIGGEEADFLLPTGEYALAPPGSVSWRIFNNPVTLFIGGVAAVILELAEPRVRTGVWENTTFRTDPVGRLRRTGRAAMITVYGARSVAEAMIARVNAIHRTIHGVTPEGAPFRATDPDLLTWVQATAAFGFLEAYAAYDRRVSDDERDRFYAEGLAAAELYGALGAPASAAEQRALFRHWNHKLVRSPVIFEFLSIIKRAKALPGPTRIAQGAFIKAAVEILPADLRTILGLGPEYALNPIEAALVRIAARRAGRLYLPHSPAVLACRRLGLGADFLYQ